VQLRWWVRCGGGRHHLRMLHEGYWMRREAIFNMTRISREARLCAMLGFGGFQFPSQRTVAYFPHGVSGCVEKRNVLNVR